uniref:Uncharacterized protein n=1 Tax=Siphoviridae sp. cttFh17 TaxID=2826491 RepID=A0A8S5NJ81_9CAUD|nr:MAG TPA: hypothetical protein [Siphoviridae sp. cttFh17]
MTSQFLEVDKMERNQVNLDFLQILSYENH